MTSIAASAATLALARELSLSASAHLGNQAGEISQIGVETFGRTFQEGHALQTEAFQTKREFLFL
jgi:hypothetical protein